MTAFLKLDRCCGCCRNVSWEWVPPVFVHGKPLAGTGVWHSDVSDGLCSNCRLACEDEREKEKRASGLRHQLIGLFGGQKPLRGFTFETYQEAPGNQLAFNRAKAFNSHNENLYFWGPCGVGKTHLAYAIARRAFENNVSVEILTSPKLYRRVRMKDPDQEQDVIDCLVRVQVLVLDDLGIGTDTAYSRQILQEILDGRDFHERRGLVITSKYSLTSLAQKLDEDTLPSRLAGMCSVIEIRGRDGRVRQRSIF